MNMKSDKWLSRFYGKMPYEDYTLLDRAVRTLIANTGNPAEPFPWSPRRGIMPSAIGFLGVWNWDTAFAAIGAAYFDSALARDQIEIFLDLQTDSGLFPDVWRKDGSLIDNFGKPPVLAWAAWRVYQADPDEAFLQRCFDAFVKNEEFWRRERGGDHNGLLHYASTATDSKKRYTEACYESGWDNSVRWDNGIENIWPIDLNCFMVMTYRALANMAEVLGKNTIVFREREARLTELIEERLWCEEDKSYYDYDFENHRFVKALTPASFMPLYIVTAPQKRAEYMAIQAERLSPGWPSVSYDHPEFDPTGYWRGRTWYNIAYFALKGLKNYGFDNPAEIGRATLLDWARGNPGALCENYHPLTGMPVGCPQFSWTAVFIMEFLLNW